MRTKFTAILAPALALGVLAVTAEAQQHRATRLGNPATRFAKPLKKSDDLRVLLRADKMKADVAAILSEVGWKGNHEDLDRAAASAEISEVQVAPGTRLPFMASRTKKKPHALVDGGEDGPPPHAAEQLVSTQVESVSSSAAPVGCADMQAEMHASSLQASPHVTRAVQSAFETQAVFWAQQLVSRHVSQVASPVESPQAPPPPADRV